MIRLTLLCFLLSAQLSNAQIADVRLDHDPVFMAVSRRILYPVDAEQSGIYAKIYAGFRIDQKGHIQDIQILNPIKVGYQVERIKIRRL